MISRHNIVLIPEHGDAPYIYRMKDFLGNANLRILADNITLLFNIEQACKESKSTKVICSSLKVLKMLLQKHGHAQLGEDAIKGMESTEAYQGSMFFHKSFTGETLEILVLPPLRFLQFQPELKWLIPRWCQKLTSPNCPDFGKPNWQMVGPENFAQFYDLATKADFIGVDIETSKEPVDPEKIAQNPEAYDGIWAIGPIKKSSKKEVHFTPKITFCSYSLVFVHKDRNTFEVVTGVVQVDSMEKLGMLGKLNLTDAPKILQNGGYDCTYFLRFNIPLRNYMWDTYVMMHSWMVELKRNLSFICSLFNKRHMYWKDESEYNMAEYNAKDTHNMVNAFMYMLQEFPKYAMDNYAENFRMQFPCIHCGMEGFLVDEQERRSLLASAEVKLNTLQYVLDTVIAPGFNPNSPKHVMQLFQGLGYTKAKNADDKTLQDFKNSNILWDYLGDLIIEFRETKKLISTYLTPKLIGGRFLYELNPAGTDTGRLASKASNLWVGSNIQNQPSQNNDVKRIYVADPGYVLSDIDNSQSESRCTAYMAEDEGLIAAVESPADFHKTNATKFFGLPYEKITKEIRKLSKRVNHGANYNMGPGVLLQTMGLKNVLLAKRLLKLPSGWKPYKVCVYLLECFDNAYPNIKGKYYKEVIDDVEVLGMLVGPTGWTRRCFGNPSKNKLDLNSYVAHGPQSLSVKAINAAFFDCWLELQLKQQRLRFKAQVHDSLMWQDKPEHTEENARYIAERMRKPITVRGRQMVIPNDPMLGKKNWSELKG